MQTLLPVPVVDDVTASKVGPPPPVRPHRHDHVIARCQHGQVHLRRRHVRDDVVRRLKLLPAPAGVIRDEDEDDVTVALTHVVHGLADVGGRGGVVALSYVVRHQEVPSPHVHTNLRLVADLKSVLLQQIGSWLADDGLEGELPLDRAPDEVEVLPRLQVLHENHVLLGQALELGVVAGEVLLEDHFEAPVRVIRQAGRLEDAADLGGGPVVGLPAAVHLGDAQERGVLEHLVAQLPRDGDGHLESRPVPLAVPQRGHVGIRRVAHLGLLGLLQFFAGVERLLNCVAAAVAAATSVHTAEREGEGGRVDAISWRRDSKGDQVRHQQDHHGRHHQDGDEHETAKPPPHSSFRLGSARLGSARVGSGQLRSARVSSARVGSGRVGSTRIGSVRLGSARLGSAQLGPLALLRFLDQDLGSGFAAVRAICVDSSGKHVYQSPGSFVHSCITSKKTTRLIRDGEPRTATSTFTQLLSSEQV